MRSVEHGVPQHRGIGVASKYRGLRFGEPERELQCRIVLWCRLNNGVVLGHGHRQAVARPGEETSVDGCATDGHKLIAAAPEGGSQVLHPSVHSHDHVERSVLDRLVDGLPEVGVAVQVFDRRKLRRFMDAPVEDRDIVAPGEQPVNDVRTRWAGSTHEQYPHGLSPGRWYRRRRSAHRAGPVPRSPPRLQLGRRQDDTATLVARRRR